MSAFGAEATRSGKIVARGHEKCFERAITVADIREYAREVGIYGTFYAYKGGVELEEGQFPVTGAVELREYAAPKNL
jgi:hypothetical protein